MKRIFTNIISYLVFICVLSLVLLNLHSISYADDDENIKADATVKTSEKSMSDNIKDEEIKQFINDYFEKKMDEYNVPGAQVAVVRNNSELLKSSYGYADLKTQEKVDMDNATFPAASVSKLFTSVAIMQLYEQGKLNLDTDVNEYISPYNIENKYDKPVTCRNLLTHSSGLDEESEVNTKTEDVNNIKSQEYYMEHNKSVVLNEPGSICRYCNQGYNILGFIIEKVSKVSYEEYIKENILNPLKMDKSTVRINDDNMAKGYLEDNTEVPLSYQYTSGSSGIICNAQNMENFMTAILNDGIFENTRILKSETVAMMKKTQFTNNPVYPGMGLGFIKSDRNGANILKHEGGLPGYVTTLFLLPDENLGIYIATNKMAPLPFNFEEEFLNHFYPQDDSEFNSLLNNSDPEKDYSKYEGKYRSYDGISKTSFAKIFSFEEDTEIKDNKDGTLSLTESTNEHTKNTTRLVEKEENVFVREDNKGYYTFRTDDKGKIKYAFNDVSHNSFEKINFLESSDAVYIVMYGVVILYILNLIFTIILRFKNRKKIDNAPKSIERLSKLNITAELLIICGILGAVFTSSSLMYFNDYYFSIKWLYFALSVILLSVIIFIFELCISSYMIIKKTIQKKNVVYWIVFNTVNILLICYLQYFNLIGYKMGN